MENNKTIRTRFAPSPTGYMHIGNLRAALYAFLIAKKENGKFLLRIEDTDQARLVGDAVDVIYKSLKTTNLLWDEGPDCGGPVGPYIQSERKEIYKKYADELIANGHAYRCFCTKEELDIQRAVSSQNGLPFSYDGRCSHLSKEEIADKTAKGIPCVIRQKIHKDGSTTFTDHVFGEITIENSQLDDQVLMKSDGFPTYNFANVVDDHLMNITHVVRGMEYLSSTPKYIQLYKNFGWNPPEHIHLPHILGPSGKKLSKREGSVALDDFLVKGYLPDAIINYIALLGWNPGTEEEFFTLEDLKKRFEISQISKASAIFNEVKLNWINGLHIRAKTPEQFHELCMNYYPANVKAKINCKLLSTVIQARLERMAQIPEIVDFLVNMPKFDIKLFEHKKMKSTLESTLKVLKDIIPEFEAATFDHKTLYDLMVNFATKNGLKNGTVMYPVRVALSGLEQTPGGAVEIAELLGKEETLKRIRDSINLLSN